MFFEILPEKEHTIIIDWINVSNVTAADFIENRSNVADIVQCCRAQRGSCTSYIGIKPFQGNVS